jgi:hypothetical protein
VLENKVLERIFGPKRDLNNKKLEETAYRGAL